MMQKLKITELQDRLEDIFGLYDKGDDTKYLIDGSVVLVPFEGPWTETIKETEDGDLFVEIPQRLLSKLGIDINDELDITTDGTNIIIKKVENERK